ncbi:glutaminase A [Parahaliea mediterranea]|uniref:Glutaminase n=1 Tax=Parahaliea mediterranea TaxID=651086 RepID=A0A939IL80_9GAMM|nr:glutaminase A [Parahaliea mediterranea]MBN7796215.1 glutaminase A [Parahaliea mediterranea]
MTWRLTLAAWALAACLPGAPVQASERAAIQAAINTAYETYKGLEAGETAQYIPALAAADPDRFGIVAITVDGEVISRGDTEQPFAIMSAAKPFTLALLLSQQGRNVVLKRIGVEPTGQPFNALAGVERRARKPLNPMVNAGAITAVSLLEADDADARWQLIRNGYNRFAGEPLTLLAAVYRSVGASNFRNRALANLLSDQQWLGAPVDETLDVYNRQSSVAVTARQLAVMGATLANAGENPVTGEQVLARDLVDEVLAVMMMNGFYDESGRWAYNAGLPAKSGVGGGIVAVVPGKMALVGYSPRLSTAGNSVRGMKALEAISAELGLSLFRPGLNSNR